MSFDYRLRLVAGPRQVGALLPLREGRTATVGRRPDCTLCLSSPRVSPLHVQFVPDGIGWKMLAGQTTSGKTAFILINEAHSTEWPLSPGDRIETGGHRFVFEDDLPLDPTQEQHPMIRLQIRHGPAAPERTFMAWPGESFIVGHSQTALWMLPEPSASRHHCRFETQDSGWRVRDLQSRNGTFLDGQRVTSAPLCHLARLMVGRYDVQVELLDLAPSA